NFQIVILLAIDGLTSIPFHATTLPLPKSINQNKTKVLKVSKERYTRSVETKKQIEPIEKLSKEEKPQKRAAVQQIPQQLPKSQVLVTGDDLIREIPEALRKKKP